MSATVLLRPYCTLADVQRETQNTDPDDVESFKQAINQASRWIDWYCRRDFYYHDHSTGALSVEENWTAGAKIFLPWPVITLTQVQTQDVFGSSTVLPAESYRVQPSILTACGVIVSDTRWVRPDVFTTGGLLPQRSNAMAAMIQLTGTFGYAPVMTSGGSPVIDTTKASVDIPMEISTACAVIAAVRSGKSKKEIIDYSGQKQSATVKAIPRDVMEMIGRYRRPIV
jgi:hypothetical protein